MAFSAPPAVIRNIAEIGYAKSQASSWKTLVLGFLAGAYIAFGSLFALRVAGGITSAPKDIVYQGLSLAPSNLSASGYVIQELPQVYRSVGIGYDNPGLVKLLMGAVFPVGLIFVVLCGAELFTGNCMFLPVAYLAFNNAQEQTDSDDSKQQKYSKKKVVPFLNGVLRNWGLSYFGNLCGSIFIAYLLSHQTELLAADPWNSFTQSVGKSKVNLSFFVILLRGIGANWLVCLALFLGFAAHSVAGKLMGLWWPIFAFVAIGFEHSVANMFFIPTAMYVGASDISTSDFLMKNLIPATLGNIIGGSLFVAFLEWLVYYPKIEEKKQDIPMKALSHTRSKKKTEKIEKKVSADADSEEVEVSVHSVYHSVGN